MLKKTLLVFAAFFTYATAYASPPPAYGTIGSSPSVGLGWNGSGWQGYALDSLGNVIVDVGAGSPSGAPLVAATTSISTTSTQIFAARTGRLSLRIVNLASLGGASIYCTDDGSTPSATNAIMIIAAQGAYERDIPSFVPPGAINCISASGTISMKAEQF